MAVGVGGEEGTVAGGTGRGGRGGRGRGVENYAVADQAVLAQVGSLMGGLDRRGLDQGEVAYARHTRWGLGLGRGGSGPDEGTEYCKLGSDRGERYHSDPDNPADDGEAAGGNGPGKEETALALVGAEDAAGEAGAAAVEEELSWSVGSHQQPVALRSQQLLMQ